MNELWQGESDDMAKDTKSFVNLDALIPRADLFEHPDRTLADTPSLRITDLEPGMSYNLLRKPDFQRETANWSPAQVAGLVETFCASDIIPAVILWQNGSQVFIVDGAHRLSALIAWVRADYGAGDLSMNLFKGKIPAQQRLLHEQTSELIEKSIGNWETYKQKNSILGLKSLVVQWINGQTAQQAAKAFIRINQGGTVIDNLEVRILQASRSALSIATRVITRGGSGHAYWINFLNENARVKTPILGSEIFSLLYEPALQTPIKSLNVPLAGVGYGASVIRFAFDLAALTNGLIVPDSSRKSKTADGPMVDDVDGIETLNYLNRTKKVIQLISSNEAKSLGLHPLLYFYTVSGTFQPTAFLNTAAWIISLEKRNKIDEFLSIRGSFESLILAHPSITKPATRTLGSGTRSRSRALQIFDQAVALLLKGNDVESAWSVLKKEYPNLYSEELTAETEDQGALGAAFSAGAKSALSFGELATAPRCELCGGILYFNGKTADHKLKKADGGGSSSKNGRWVHPRCNGNRDKIAKAQSLV